MGTRKATLVGQFGDGRKFTAGSELCGPSGGASYAVPVLVSAGGGKHLWNGTFSFAEGTPDSIQDLGNSRYYRQPAPTSAFLAAGVNVATSIHGGAYTPPAVASAHSASSTRPTASQNSSSPTCLSNSRASPKT